MLIYDTDSDGNMYVMVDSNGGEIPDSVMHDGVVLSIVDGTLLDGGKVYTVSDCGEDGVFECSVFGFKWSQITQNLTFRN